MDNINIHLSNEVMIPNKQEINIAANNLIACVEDGEMSALQAYGQLTALQELIEIAKSRISNLALYEAERYESKTFSVFGMEVQVKEVGVKYDYSENEHWRELNEQVNYAKAELKGHETTLKRIGACHRTSETKVVVNLKKS